MTNVINREWQEYKVSLRFEGFIRDTLLYVGGHSLLPYFYGAFVNFDLVIELSDKIKPVEVDLPPQRLPLFKLELPSNLRYKGKPILRKSDCQVVMYWHKGNSLGLLNNTSSSNPFTAAFRSPGVTGYLCLE